MNIAVPSFENMKSFMVFDGTPSEDSFIFNGDFDHFSESFFTNPEWEAIEAWAADQGYTLAIEGSDVYVEMAKFFEEQDFDTSDGYDEDGELIPHGMFDEGGHLVDVEAYFEAADEIRDRNRDEH